MTRFRTIWKAAEANGTFGAIVRLCPVDGTAHSRKVAHMRWADLVNRRRVDHPEGGPREKGHRGRAGAAGRGTGDYP